MATANSQDVASPAVMQSPCRVVPQSPPIWLAFVVSYSASPCASSSASSESSSAAVVGEGAESSSVLVSSSLSSVVVSSTATVVSSTLSVSGEVAGEEASALHAVSANAVAIASVREESLCIAQQYRRQWWPDLLISEKLMSYPLGNPDGMGSATG